MKSHFRYVMLSTLALVVLSAFVNITTPLASASTIIRWDIVNLTLVNGTPTLTAGGHATAIAQDGSWITFTGKGAFLVPAAVGSTLVVGGGTWKTFSPTGSLTGHGTYKVTKFISFVQASGFVPAAIDDEIAERDDGHSGLAYLRIAYSDGSSGELVVSCNLPGAPHPNIFEGVTASKGFVAYWNRTDPQPGVNANRTVFHTIP
jgi:hypothetical protein